MATKRVTHVRAPLVKVAMRGLRGHFAILLATAVAVAIGSTYLTTVLALHYQVDSSMRESTQAIAVHDLYVVEGTEGDEASEEPSNTSPSPHVGFEPSWSPLQSEVESAAGVASVLPVFDEVGALFGGNTSSFGADLLPVVFVGGAQGAEWPAIVSGVAPTSSDQVALEQTGAKRRGLTVGDQITVAYGSVSNQVSVSGILRYPAPITNQVTVLLSDAAVHEATSDATLIGSTPSVLGVNLKTGLSPEEAQEGLQNAVGRQGTVFTPSEYASYAASTTNASLRTANLTLFLFVLAALMVSVFIIANTLRVLALRKDKDAQTLWLLGIPKKRIVSFFLTQVVVVAAAGSAIGAAVGAALARGFLSTPVPNLTAVAATAFVTGVLVTLVASIPAAQVLLLGGAAISHFASRGRVAAGLGLTAIGLTGVGLGAFTLPSYPWAYLGVGTVLLALGVPALSPYLLEGWTGHVGGSRKKVLQKKAVGPSTLSWRLAAKDINANPKQGAAATASLLIGVALAAGGATVAQSVSASTANTAEDQITSAFIAQPTPPLQVLPKDALEAVTASPLVSGVADQVGFATFDLERSEKIETVDALLVDPNYLGSLLDLPVVEGAQFDGPNEVVIARAFAKKVGLSVGDELPLASVGGNGFEIVGIAEELLGSTQVAGTPSLADAHPQAMRFPAFAFVTTAPPEKPEIMLGEIKTELRGAPAVEVTEPSGLHTWEEQAAALAHPLLLLILGFAIAASLLAVGSALGLFTVERKKQFRLLSVLGLPKGSIKKVVTKEAAMLAFYGTSMGLLLGLGLGWAVQHYLGSWGYRTYVFPTQTVLIAVAAGLATALVAPRLGATRIAAKQAAGG